MAGDGLKVVGASEFRRLLKEIQEPNLTDKLKDVHQEVAEIVVNRARRNAAGLGRRAALVRRRKPRAHRFGGIPAPVVAASTLRAVRRQTGAAVTLGSAQVPFALGQEFGAYPDRQRSAGRRRFIGYRQFPSRSKSGHFLYPAVGQMRDEITKAYLDGIDDIVSRIK